MLQDLYILEKYFSPSFSISYEQDLIEKYGFETVQSAIKSGFLDHGYIPCGKEKRRCVCRLSEKGTALIEERLQDL